jgi:hypothetical protein
LPPAGTATANGAPVQRIARRVDPSIPGWR